MSWFAKRVLLSSAVAVGLGLPVSAVKAASITVPANDVIYAAGLSGSALTNYLGSLAVAAGKVSSPAAPAAVTLPANAASVSFSVTGSVTLNVATGTNPNNPDGVGAAASSSSNTGANNIAGLQAPNAGYLTGVFLSSGGATSPAPSALNFLSGGLGTSFAQLSPLLGQAFFIGDGLTGNGSGAVQTFNVPMGAGLLYLGISDACGYNGSPSCYSDNDGSFSVTYTVAAGGSTSVAEPASAMLLGAGLASLTLYRRRKN